MCLTPRAGATIGPGGTVKVEVKVEQGPGQSCAETPHSRVEADSALPGLDLDSCVYNITYYVHETTDMLVIVPQASRTTTG